MQKICLSKFPQRKIQFHKEVAAQMNLGTATRPISPVEVGKYQKVMTNAFTSFPKFSQLRFSVQCTWSFFQCKKNAETCKMEHDDCLNGNICTLSNPKCNILNTFFISVDNKICAGVATHPQRYLVPHPTDCTKFYSCQRQGWGGWIANPMDCPVTTGFDKSLMICNYINSLPRCKEDTLGSLRSDDLGRGLIAKQTQQQLEVQVGDLGYLSARNLTSHSRKLLIVNPSILLCLFVSLRLLL